MAKAKHKVDPYAKPTFAAAAAVPADLTPATDDALEYRVPLALCATGLALAIAAALVAGGASAIGSALLTGAMVVAIKVPIVIVGLFIVAAMFDMAYGNFWPATVKLAAIELLRYGVISLAEAVGGEGVGIAAALVMVLASWYLLSLMFDLETSELFITVAALWALGWLLQAFVLGALLSAAA